MCCSCPCEIVMVERRKEETVEQDFYAAGIWKNGNK